MSATLNYQSRVVTTEQIPPRGPTPNPYRQRFLLWSWGKYLLMSFNMIQILKMLELSCGKKLQIWPWPWHFDSKGNGAIILSCEQDMCEVPSHGWKDHFIELSYTETTLCIDRRTDRRGEISISSTTSLTNWRLTTLIYMILTFGP